MSDLLLMFGAIAIAFIGAWLLHKFCPGVPPDPRDDEHHTYELKYDAPTGITTCETWCPKCHAWKAFRYTPKHYYPSCEHRFESTTIRGWREILRFDREQGTYSGYYKDNFVLNFHNLIDFHCYGKPVNGSTERRTIEENTYYHAIQ